MDIFITSYLTVRPIVTMKSLEIDLVDYLESFNLLPLFPEERAVPEDPNEISLEGTLAEVRTLSKRKFEDWGIGNIAIHPKLRNVFALAPVSNTYTISDVMESLLEFMKCNRRMTSGDVSNNELKCSFAEYLVSSYQLHRSTSSHTLHQDPLETVQAAGVWLRGDLRECVHCLRHVLNKHFDLIAQLSTTELEAQNHLRLMDSHQRKAKRRRRGDALSESARIVFECHVTERDEEETPSLSILEELSISYDSECSAKAGSSLSPRASVEDLQRLLRERSAAPRMVMGEAAIRSEEEVANSWDAKLTALLAHSVQVVSAVEPSQTPPVVQVERRFLRSLRKVITAAADRLLASPTLRQAPSLSSREGESEMPFETKMANLGTGAVSQELLEVLGPQQLLPFMPKTGCSDKDVDFSKHLQAVGRSGFASLPVMVLCPIRIIPDGASCSYTRYSSPALHILSLPPERLLLLLPLPSYARPSCSG